MIFGNKYGRALTVGMHDKVKHAGSGRSGAAGQDQMRVTSADPAFFFF